jgi:multidrug resistance efflux pump
MAQQSASAASRHAQLARNHTASARHHASSTASHIASLQPQITAVQEEVRKVVLIEEFEAISAIVQGMHNGCRFWSYILNMICQP